jgi:eukaryotic-like serine/threonine-protein kinase
MTDRDRLAAALADRYRIEQELGQGGMATVYLAEDLKHDRKVAIKVLHPELSAVIGAERFLREIKTIASLQHPHILGLIDSGEVTEGHPEQGEGSRTAYYVMPYVEGESLRDRLSRDKQLPVADAIRIAGEVASALDYAHRHGVIHRDIKPANILLHDGQALVADFGIALAVSSAGGTRITETGMSLGTPHYMSPEQAMGEREITARSDIYALGCVTYEMLIGDPPFTGSTAQAIVARVLTEAPRPMTAQRHTIPAHVEQVVLKALEKLPADRWGSAAEFAEGLAGRGMTIVPAARSRPGTRSWAIIVAGTLLGAAAGFVVGRSRAPAAPAAGPAYMGERLGGPQIAMQPRLSPDGKMLAFIGMVGRQSQVGVLNTVSGDWKMLTHDTTQGLAESVVWSPDGSRIFYDRFSEAPRGVYSVSPLGGEERLVLHDACSPYSLSDGSLLVLRYNANRLLQLFRYWPQTGKIDSLAAISNLLCNATSTWMDVFPGEQEAVFVGGIHGVASVDTMFAIDLKTGTSRVLSTHVGSAAVAAMRVAADGQSVLVAEPFGDELAIRAIPRDGSDRQRTLLTVTSLIYAIDVGKDGSLYLDQHDRPVEVLTWSPTTGRLDRMPLPEANRVAGILPLADGTILGTAVSGGVSRIVAYAPGKDPVEFLTSGEAAQLPVVALGTDRVMMRTQGDTSPSLIIAYAANGQIAGRIPGFNHAVFAGSPDGNTIYYADSGAIWAMPSDGGPARRIHDGDAVAPDPHGKYLVIQLVGRGGNQLLRVSLDGSAAQEIPVRSSLPIADNFLAPNAVGPAGRIAVEIGPPSLWYWPPAILDPRTGTLTVPPGFGYDGYAGWSPDGRFVATSYGLQSTMWRFRPITGATRTP